MKQRLVGIYVCVWRIFLFVAGIYVWQCGARDPSNACSTLAKSGCACDTVSGEKKKEREREREREKRPIT
jgi:hypothetical protein